MSNGNGNAEHTNRTFSFNPSMANIIAFCRGSILWDGPTAELDMFSRWIKLSDRALAANQSTRKQSRSRARRQYKAILAAKSA